MPAQDRPVENRRLFRYPVEAPFQNRRTHPSRVTPGTWVRCWGVDGRFVGAARSFPGFKRVLDIQAAPFNDDSANYWKELGTEDPETDPYYWTVPIDNTGMTGVWFAKYIAVQVPEFSSIRTGDTHGARTLRGFAIAHDYLDGENLRGVFRYYFYDPVEERWAYHDLYKEVEDLDDYIGDINNNDNTSPEWPFVTFYTDEDGLIDSTSHFEVASMGNFIYFSIIRQPETAGAYNSVHRSIRVTGIGMTTNATAGNLHLNVHTLWAPSWIGPMDTKVQTEASKTVVGAMSYPTNYAPILTEIDRTEGNAAADITGEVKTAFRMFSSAKNVAGPLQRVEVATTAKKSIYTLKWVFYIQKVVNQYYRRRMPDYLFDLKARTYRTLDSAMLGETSGQSFILGGTMFREESDGIWDDPGTKPSDNGNYASVTEGDPEAGAEADDVVVLEPQIDPYRDDTMFSPGKLWLILPYQGTMLRVGTVPNVEVTETISDRDQIFSWGALDKFAPEQFRVVDSTPLGASQDETALVLVAAGDYAFAVGDTSIFRIHRAGNRLAINEIQTLAGGVNRFAAVGVGTTMFYVNTTGVYAVEGATGDFQLISALDRIIQEDWRQSLGDVHLSYDNNLGAIILMNTTEKEMVLMWNNTGAVTGLKDVPFKFGMYGVDPVNVDDNRSWWITDEGKVYTPNAERSSDAYGVYTEGAFTMCGGDPDKVWNVELPDETHTTTEVYIVVADDGEFDDAAVGFEIYFLSGDNRDESRTITAVELTDGDTKSRVTFTPALDQACSEDDRIAISPVYYELIGWPLQDPREAIPDPFQRKKLLGMSQYLNLIAGDTSTEDNPNLRMNHLAYRDSDVSSDVGIYDTKVMYANQTQNYTHRVVNGTVIYPAWRCLSSDLDFELIEGYVRGTLERSEAETAPTS